MSYPYELYYNDGGHGGPYATFLAAYTAALARLNDSTTRIEIRSYLSKIVGGYAPSNLTSFYVTTPCPENISSH
jgi:hypothetical protein